MAFELRVCAASDAPRSAEGWATHAISLLDGGQAPPAQLAPHTLVLNFDDTERASPDGPQPSHVESVLAFTSALGPEARLLVHCVAGLSRSTAMAIAVLVQHGASAERAMATVERMRPDMWPNERLCRYADAALETSGAIIAAVRHRQAELIAEFEALT